MTTYAQQIDEMQSQMLHLSALRNAQVPDTTAWWAFQHRVTDLTQTMLALEASVPVLETADREVAEAAAQARRAQRYAAASMDTVWTVTKAAGVPGLLGLLAAGLWPLPALVTLVAGLLVVVAVIAIFVGIKLRPRRYSVADLYEAELHAAQARRAEMIDRINSGIPATAAPAAPAEDGGGTGWDTHPVATS